FIAQKLSLEHQTQKTRLLYAVKTSLNSSTSCWGTDNGIHIQVEWLNKPDKSLLMLLSQDGTPEIRVAVQCFLVFLVDVELPESVGKQGESKG
ncbi:hypothetical protein LINPERPRIM_LOCUS23619, partial [Linum perenne]